MKKQLLLLLFLCPLVANAQYIINSWTLNVNGKKASYWKTTQSGMSVTYTFTTTTDSADVKAVCYTSTDVWVKSGGMTDNMGKYLNPGSCSTAAYIHRFPRTPSVPTTKTTSPKGGAIGLLTNGIPIFGLGNAASWNGTANVNNGGGIWNAEVGKNEGFVLDTAFGAHPQQQGAYHTHTTPYRLYKYYATTVHSPIIGFAFDGNPIYGPYGYTSPLSTASGISRMKSGYSLRNITTRTTLPYGVTATQAGPDVSTTYPIGSYCEDYEWLSSNGGDLDKYNGRYCYTPEYPTGTYAYFVTVDAAGVAAFPYYIGIEYYGAPETTDFSTTGTGNTVTSPTGATCIYPSALPLELLSFKGFAEKNKNKLVWETANEVDFSHYIIEKSRDAKDFKAIGYTVGKGLPNSLQTYEFMDEDPQNINYYKLTMVDKDGTQSSSKIISLTQSSVRAVAVFPTIVKDWVHISSQNDLADAVIRVSDMMGRTVLSMVKTLEKGSCADVDMSQLPKGLYLMSIATKGFNEVNKILKE